MATLGWSYSFLPTPSGNIDTGHEDGDDGTPAIPLAWGVFPSLIGLAASFSVVPRTYLSEPFPGAALISLRTVSGDDVFGAGWSYVGETLTNGSTLGSGVLALDASYNGQTVTLTLPWSRLLAGGPDTVPPSIPIVTASGTAAPITLTADPVSDVFVAGQTTAGVRRINWFRNGLAMGQPTLVNPNILGEPALIAFGGATASYSQTGKQFALTANGAGGFNGTSDEGAMLAWTVSGDFTATLRILSHPGDVSSVAHAGIMVRPSSAANSAFFQLYVPPDPATGSRIRARLAPGQTPVVGNSVSTATSGLFRVVRVGDTLFGYYRAASGWSAYGSYTVPMGQTVIVGPPLASRGTSVQTTVYSEISISTDAAVTFIDNTPFVGVANVYTATSDDLSTPANVSTASDPVTVTIAASGNFTYRLYETYDDGIAKPAKWNTATRAATAINFIREIRNIPALGGNALVQGLTRRGIGDLRVEEEAVQNAISLNLQEIWVEFDVYIDPLTNYTALSTIWQSHHRSTPVTSTSNAPVNLYIENNSFGVWTIFWEDLNGANGGTNRQTDRYRAGGANDLGAAFHTLVKGVKIHFKFHIIWDPRASLGAGCTGLFEGWKDDIQFISRKKAIGYGDYVPPAGGPTIVNNYNSHLGWYGIGSDPFTVGTNDTIIVAHKNYKEWTGSNPNGVPT